jgi:hypothetical protein
MNCHQKVAVLTGRMLSAVLRPTAQPSRSAAVFDEINPAQTLETVQLSNSRCLRKLRRAVTSSWDLIAH